MSSVVVGIAKNARRIDDQVDTMTPRQSPTRFSNWFVAQMRASVDIVVGTRFLTGHGGEGVGEYVVTAIDEVDADTVTITVKRTP